MELKNKLPPDIKEQWTTALRSGKYAQGKQYLRDDANRYCCLGVLADLCGLPWELRGGYYVVPTVTGHEPWNSGSWVCMSRLPAPVLAALKQEVHPPNSRTVERVLSGFNDSGDWSFAMIADWIDTNL